MPKVMVTVRAFNQDGYHKDILLVSEQQICMSDARVTNGMDGIAIDPKDFPEVAKFCIIVKEIHP